MATTTIFAIHCSLNWNQFAITLTFLWTIVNTARAVTTQPLVAFITGNDCQFFFSIKYRTFNKIVIINRKLRMHWFRRRSVDRSRRRWRRQYWQQMFFFIFYILGFASRIFLILSNRLKKLRYIKCDINIIYWYIVFDICIHIYSFYSCIKLWVQEIKGFVI